MFRIGRSLSGIILVIVFLSLAGLAMNIYNSENKKQQESVNLEIIDKAQALAGATIEASNFFASNKIPESVNLGEKISNTVRSIGSFVFSSKKEEIDVNLENLKVDTANTSLLEDLTNSVPVQALSGEEKLEDISNLFQEKINSLESENKQILRYEKSADGATLIISSKNGREYKINLPFKFLAE